MKREKGIFLLDSGAHSLYNKLNRGKPHSMRVKEPHKTAEFKAYLERYIEYLHTDYVKRTVYKPVMLDLIMNPKATYEVYQYMRSCGVDPMPVVHFGTEFKWLHKYMDETDYIGLGGLGQEVTKSAYVNYGDALFKEITDKDGRPRWKTHGFAMTTVELLVRYPWFSVDSTKWVKYSGYGLLLVPQFAAHVNSNGFGDPYCFLRSNASLIVSSRANAERHTGMTMVYFNSPSIKRKVNDYVKWSCKDGRLAIINDHYGRCELNLIYHSNLQRHLKLYYKERFDFEEGGNICITGMTAGKKLWGRLASRFRHAPSFFSSGFNSMESFWVTSPRSTGERKYCFIDYIRDKVGRETVPLKLNKAPLKEKTE